MLEIQGFLKIQLNLDLCIIQKVALFKLGSKCPPTNKLHFVHSCVLRSEIVS